MLMLIDGKVMHEPVLYLSLHFKLHRDAYYDALDNIRKHGAWEEWITFVLRGVVAVAQEAVNTAQQMMKPFKEDREKFSPGAAMQARCKSRFTRAFRTFKKNRASSRRPRAALSTTLWSSAS
jgi:Fic family protein